jgi:uncharacterized membrane protein
MSRHRYSGRVLTADYLRAGLGLAVTAGPVLLLDPAPPVAAVLGTLAVLFAAFALRTGVRHLTVIEVTDDGIVAQGPIPCRIAWRDVTRLRLDYFAIRREPRRGWMQLKIRGRTRRIRIDSTIDGFEYLAAAVADTARAHAIPLNDTAVANFGALGIAVGCSDGEAAA